MSTAMSNFRTLLILATLTASAACGGHASPASPSSAPPTTTTPVSGAGATIVGTVSSTSSAARIGWRAFNTSGVAVTVAGTNVSAPVDSTGSFTLTGVPPGQVVLHFSGPGIDASLPLDAVADNDHVQIGVTLSGTTVMLDTQQRTGSDHAAEAEGRVDSIDPGARQLVVHGGVIQVAVDAAIRRGDAPIGFAELKVGDRVHVRGVQNGTAIRASEVIAQSQTSTPADPVVSMKGVISGIIGACPSLSLSVGGTSVQTSASTTFSAKSCSDIVSGDTAGVVGTKRSDGTVSATAVEVSKPAAPPTPAPTPTPPTPVTLSGTLGTFNGACPTLSMLVSGKYVRTDAETTFNGKGCGDLKSGDTLDVVATNPSDNLGLLATKITVTGSGPVPAPVSVTLTGTVSAFGGTCPMLSLKVGTTYVIANAATTFSGKSCRDVKAGDAVAIVGTKPADSGTVTATTITVAPSAAPPPPTPVTLSGTIGGFGGTCPSLSMSVSGTYVSTSPATAFSGKSCGDVKVGDTVTVVGTKSTDTSVVTATTLTVTASAPPPSLVTMNGTIGSFGGTCPSLSMSVNAVYVWTDSATTFTGKSCAEIRKGDVVGVAGTRHSDGSVLATTVSANQ
jgi:hypothetical protein